MDDSTLRQRFSDLWQRLGTTGPAASNVWEKIKDHYTESHRHYHNLQHLAHCLDQLDDAGEVIEERDEIEMAIWFHDIIYVYGAKDNEAKSAEMFRELASGSMDAAFVDRVDEFIIATRHVGAASDPGVALMVDIDLSGFGLPWDGYLADSNALRLEAPSVTDADYFAGKLRFLDELVSWPSLFQSAHFNDKLEQQAQDNIRRYSDMLRDEGFGPVAMPAL